MAETDSNPNTPPDEWHLLLTDAAEFVRAAMNCPEDDTARYLLDYACACSPSHWRCQYYIDVTEGQPPPVGKPRVSPPNSKEIDVAISTRFWKEVCKGEANVTISGNSVFFEGSSFKVGATIDGKEPRVTVDPCWRFDIHISSIRFRAEPLIAALRADGGLIGAGLERLRSLGRIPPPALAAINSPTPNPVPSPPVAAPIAPSAPAPAELQPTDTRSSRHRSDDGHDQPKRKVARPVLLRLFPDRVYPSKEAVSNSDLLRRIHHSWADHEGKIPPDSPDHKPKPSDDTFLREVGRKD